jgi:type II secretory pathway component GspD/PulD (secretin)
VTDVPSNIDKIEKVLQRIDTITPQVLIEGKIIEMNLGDADKLGIKWDLRVGLTGSARPTTFPFEARDNFKHDLDRFFPAGQTTADTVSVSGEGTATTENASDFPTVTGDEVPLFPVADTGDFSFGTLDFSQMQIMLQILQTRSNSKILSEPRITVLNNQEASILVGEILAVPVFERNETTGRMEITGYAEKELGIGLQVTPQINSENQIDISLHPSIKNLIGYDALTADIVAPRFATRDAQTKVRVRNGETIVVGGLIKEEVIDTVNKLPILGDLPLLNKLFSFNERTVTKTDLLFLITVTIIEEPEIKVDRDNLS